MSNENENLYPNLNLQNKVILSEEETRKFIDSNLNESRIKHMFKERDALVKDLKHYTKILRRWKKIVFGNLLLEEKHDTFITDPYNSI